MNEDPVVTPRERLVEVLLEDALRGAPGAEQACPRPSHSPWLAAAVLLLGLGAVIGVVYLRHQPEVDRPLPAGQPDGAPQEQDPAARRPWRDSPGSVPIANQAEWDALLPHVTNVTFGILQRGADDGGVELRIGATASLAGAEARAFAATVPAIGTEVIDPEIAANPPFEGWLRFDAGERHVHAFVRLWDQPMLALGARSVGSPPDVWQGGVQRLWQAALGNFAKSRGVVTSLDELAELPASTRAIRCPTPPNGSVARHLGRFTQLEHLELLFESVGIEIPINFTPGQPVSIQLPEVPRPAALAELAVLPALRHLRIAGSMLADDDAAAELARLPALVSLRIDGAFGPRSGLTAAGMRLLADEIATLELVDVDLSPELLEPWLAAGRLRKLVLFGGALPPATLARIARLPLLRDLSLGGVAWRDEHLAVLAGSAIEVLRLEYTDVTPAGLLPVQRGLRLLDLRRQTFTPAEERLLGNGLPNGRILQFGDVDPEVRDPFEGVPSKTRR